MSDARAAAGSQAMVWPVGGRGGGEASQEGVRDARAAAGSQAMVWPVGGRGGGEAGQEGARDTAAARVTAAVKVYGSGDTEVRALDGVTLGFTTGRFTAIMGPSGSGKSTLMHCAAGLDTLTSGQAHIGATELGALSDKRLTLLRRERVGFVFQAFNLLPTLTVAENVTLPQDLAGSRPDAEWTRSLIDVVGLGDRLHHRPGELSGGQQQRVAVARALASRPEVVFADEPTGNLDSRSGEEVLGLLGEAVRRMGRTVVMVTHDPVAAAHADEVVFLADGRLVGRMEKPTAERVLDQLKSYDRAGVVT
ncbi:ABC transporter ATP-binding protein [Streptomyces sp. NBC_01186]|uniref:ABC transporter ATP-binding protein n=1 Tax=Streptomyces sp. NBC_01186 TaxID=2903765 RepID=UPI003FA7EC0C